MQALWLGVLSSRGWFYLDDLNFMAQAVHRTPDWTYLTSPVNAHLTPGLRIVFWVIVRTAHFNYTATILGRLVLQAVATVLMYKLLDSVSSSRRASLVVTGLYAFNPLLVPATLYLSSDVNQAPAQIGALLALYGCVRYSRTASLRWAAVSGGSLFFAACFWEKTAADTAIVLVIFRVGWLMSGTLRQRLTQVVRGWAAWSLMLGPLAIFAGYFLAHGYGTSTGGFSVTDAARLAWQQWLRALWPSVVGAPWHWSNFTGLYQFNSFSAPGTVAIVCGQIAFVGLLAQGWRRARWGGLLAWTLPLVAVVLGEALVGLGRYQAFGNLAALDYHYAYDLAVPTALAAILSCWSARPSAERRTAPEPARGRRLDLVWLGGTAALLVSSVITASLWTGPWHKNPTHAYVSQVLASLRQAGPAVSVYDTSDAVAVMPIIEPGRFLSDLSAIAGLASVFDSTPPDPMIVDDSGRLRSAVFLTAAQSATVGNSFCPRLIRGSASVTVPLSRTLSPNDYFLRINYFQQQPSLLHISVRGSDGKPLTARDDPNLKLVATAGQSITALAFGSPSSVVITGTDATDNVCLASIDVGVPLVASR